MSKTNTEGSDGAIGNVYYMMDIEDIYRKFNVNPDLGLSDEQAKLYIQKYGVNELKKVKRSFFKVIIAPIINLLIIIYLISAFAMWALGEVKRTLPTFIILGINALVAIIQQFRAEHQMKALKKLSAAQNFVLRNGTEKKLNSDEITLGDIVLLRQGDKVPADCRIIESINLAIDESSLTGESEPVKKSSNSAPLTKEGLPIQDQKNMVFLGTYVASGRAKVIVVKIGMDTELGKINMLLEEANTGDIPLRKKMNTLAIKLGIGVVILLSLSIIYNTIILYHQNLLDWDSFRYALINALDLGLKVMPINLPLLTTIVLLMGVIAMAQKGTIVREISRTESLGRVSVVCSDKTGTMTKNEMTVVIVWTLDNEYGVSGFGYNPNEGNLYILSDKNKKIYNDKILDELILSGYLNNNAKLKKEMIKTALPGRREKKYREIWSINGLPTEGALLVLALKYNKDIKKIAENYEFIYEFIFDSSIKRMSKIFRNKTDGQYYMFTKGAPEWLLTLSSHYKKGDGDRIYEMNEEIRAKIMDVIEEYASAGYRVLGICEKKIDPEHVPDNWEDENLRYELEKDLTFLGLTVILDPPREDVPGAVEACKSAGISVVMITGDSLDTGIAIAKQLGIFDPSINYAVEGNQIEEIDDEKFVKTTVFGRVSPEHKQKIVQRYQDLGKVVSMSGDGINDALALSMADCGLAMGIQGTEVAKEAADMIITDDSFSTIVTGIREGRALFAKIRTIIYFFVCISVMEAIILFGFSLVPDQSWALYDYWQLNLLYVTAHMFPSLGFTFDTVPKNIMKEKPKNSEEILPKNMMKLIGVHMFLIGVSMVSVYLLCYFNIIPIFDTNLKGITTYTDATLGKFITLQHSKARTMGFAVLFTLESFIMPMQIRRINEPLKNSFVDMSYKTNFGYYITSIIILAVLIYIVPLQNMMASFGWPINFMYLDWRDWSIVALYTLPTIFGFEYFRKKILKKDEKV
ncbi:MAG: cation-translocating P-type ATPase [Promethearchaeota archaeon]